MDNATTPDINPMMGVGEVFDNQMCPNWKAFFLLMHRYAKRINYNRILACSVLGIMEIGD